MVTPAQPWSDGGPVTFRAHLFAKDVRLFAYEPLDGYRDERDAVELPWERWEQEAGARGGGVVDLFAEPSRDPPDAQPPGG